MHVSICAKVLASMTCCVPKPHGRGKSCEYNVIDSKSSMRHRFALVIGITVRLVVLLMLEERQQAMFI